MPEAKSEPRPSEKFKAFAKKVLSVPKDEIERREKAQQRQKKSTEGR